MFDRKAYMKEYSRKYNKRYYINHREQILQCQEQYYVKNREYYKEYNKQYCTNNQGQISWNNKRYYINNRERILQDVKRDYLAHQEQKRRQKRQYYVEHQEQRLQSIKKWGIDNPIKRREISARHNAKRERNLGFEPLNKLFENSVAHHINKVFVIYIPKRAHETISHCLESGKNMEKINKFAINFMSREVEVLR